MIDVPQCPVVDRCGGCPHWSEPPPERAKRLASHLEQVARRSPDTVVLSGSPVGWRHRLSLRPAADGRLGLSGAGSHEVVPLPGCPVAHPLLDAALRSLPPLPGPAEVELRTDGTRVVLLVRSRSGHGKKRRGRPPERDALRAIPADTIHGVIVDGHVWRGTGTLSLPVAKQHLRASAGSFFQVHLEMNDRLIAWLRPRVRALAPAHLLDLYAGIGNLGLTLADLTGGVTLIESSRSAVEDARHNARALQLTVPVDIRRGDAHRFRAGDAFYDVVIIDPPRRGAGRMITELAVTRPKAIVYVACDARSLARDISALTKSTDYAVAELVGFEMFPWSSHMESVAILTPHGRPVPVEHLETPCN